MVSSVMFFSQLYGDDEALTLHVVSKLLHGLRSGDLHLIARALGGDWHPPGRNLLPLPFVALFGPEVWALRLPNILMWGVTCALAACLVSGLEGRGAGWVAGLVLSMSGAFQIEAMALGLGLATFWGMALFAHLAKHPPRPLTTSDARQQFAVAASLAALGFLWFTSLFVLSAMLHAAYLIAALRADDRPRALFWWYLMNLPFGVFYLGYYAVFLGVPYYMVARGLVAEPFGQLHQYLVRKQTAHINFSALVENIGTANYYTFPLAYVVLALAGLVAMFSRFPYIALLIGPYALLISCYVSGNTGPHFLSFVIWTVPFGIAYLARWRILGQGVRRMALALLLPLVAAWTILLHVRPYTDGAYPYSFARLFVDEVRWPNNAFMPLNEIKHTARMAAGNGPITSLVGDAWRLHYLPELNWEPKAEVISGPDGCLDHAVAQNGMPVTAILATRARRLCRGEPSQTITFPGSNIVVFLSQPPTRP